MHTQAFFLFVLAASCSAAAFRKGESSHRSGGSIRSLQIMKDEMVTSKEETV